jgi:uncharacterized protein (DUF302 family)
MTTHGITAFARGLCAAVFTLAASGAAMADGTSTPVAASGIITVKSAYPLNETILRLKKDVAGKGIRFFDEIDQGKLAADAGIQLRPSTLLVFGNPPLGTLFITANPLAGLDWPVRLLVFQDERGDVYAAYTDFSYIARRHQIEGADLEAFRKATGVIASITSSVTAQ